MLSYVKSTGKPPKIVVELLDKVYLLSAVSFMIAILYTLYAISQDAVENTRISENALLPGLVEENFRDGQMVFHYIKKLKKEEGNRRQLRKVIYDELKRLQIETYKHGFQSHPSSFVRTNSSAGSGENIYGIVRSFRAAPGESILVVVRIDEAHISSIATALTLANYAKQKLYWARDVMFLFVDGEKLATEAWMAAYHGYDHPFLEMDELDTRGGPIIGAMVLDLVGNGNVFNHINIEYGMVNGRLPNLDLVNLLILLVEKFGTSPTLHNVAHHPSLARQHYDYGSAMLTFLRSIFSQSFIEYEGLHSIIGGYGVNAVTLQARQTSVNGRRNYNDDNGMGIDTVEMVKIAEGGLRSLNNILEKFHQSYFLYFLTHPHKFISVAYYMPIIGLLILPIVLWSLRDWIEMDHIDTSPLLSICVTHLLAIFSYALQVFFYSLPQSSAKLISSVGIAIPLLPIYLFSSIESEAAYFLMRFIVGLEAAVFIGALSLLNFSLSLSLAVILVPFLFFISVSRNLSFKGKLAGFLITNPITICIALCLALEFGGVAVIINVVKFNSDINTLTTVWNRLVKYVIKTALNHFVHSSSFFPIVHIVVLPIWNIAMQILLYKPNTNSKQKFLSNDEVGTSEKKVQ